MDEQRYAELFPNSTYSTYSATPLFGEYAQAWLNGREVVTGTRKNYRISLNLYWMPHLALIPMDQITSPMLRKIVSETEWKSPTVKRSAIQRLTTLLETAVKDELLTRNPANSIELPTKAKKAVDPFTVEEADRLLGTCIRC